MLADQAHYRILRSIPGLPFKAGQIVSERECRNARWLVRQKLACPVDVTGSQEIVAALEADLAVRDGVIAGLRTEIAAKDTSISELRAEVDDLQAQLARREPIQKGAAVRKEGK
jgi:uncharacterized coiled-coil protein SlyX